MFFQRMAEVDAPSEALPVPPAEVPEAVAEGGLEIWVDSVVYKKTTLTMLYKIMCSDKIILYKKDCLIGLVFCRLLSEFQSCSC